jgi:hypothetical protein
MFSNRLGRYMTALGAVLALGLASAGYSSAEESMEDPYLAAVAEAPEGLPVEAPADPPEDPPEEEGFTCAGEFSLVPKSENRFNSGFTSVDSSVLKGSVTVNCEGFYLTYEPVWNPRINRVPEDAKIVGVELPAWETKFGDLSLGAESAWVRLYLAPDGVDPTVNTVDLYGSYTLPDSLRRYGLGRLSCKHTWRIDDEGTMYQCGVSTLFPPLVEIYGFDITPQLGVDVAGMDGLFGHKKFPTNIKGRVGVTGSREMGDIVVSVGAMVDRHWGYGKLEEGGFGNACVGSGFLRVDIPDLFDF